MQHLSLGGFWQSDFTNKSVWISAFRHRAGLPVCLHHTRCGAVLQLQGSSAAYPGGGTPAPHRQRRRPQHLCRECALPLQWGLPTLHLHRQSGALTLPPPLLHTCFYRFFRIATLVPLSAGATIIMWVESLAWLETTRSPRHWLKVLMSVDIGSKAVHLLGVHRHYETGVCCATTPSHVGKGCCRVGAIMRQWMKGDCQQCLCLSSGCIGNLLYEATCQ